MSRDFGSLPDTMSGALPISTSSDAELEKSIHSINSFDTFYIPDFEFGDKKLYSQEERSVSPQQKHTPRPQERNIIVS